MSQIETHTIDPVEFESLNREYYRSNPTIFLWRRMYSLLLFLGKRDEVWDLLRQKIKSKHMQIQLEDNDVHEDAKGDDEYTVSESLELFHHSTETLFRLYFGHANRNPCPWSAISQNTSFSKFKRQIADFPEKIKDEQTMDNVLEVFSYARTPDFMRGDDHLQEQWEDHRNALRLFLSNISKKYMDEANIYNAVKHGLTIVEEERSVSLTAGEDTTPLLRQEGHSVSFLEKKAISGRSGLYWQKSIYWVEYEKNIALTLKIIELIDSLWTSAKAHYKVGGLSKPVLLWGTEMVSRLFEFNVKQGFSITSMSERIINKE